MAAGQKTSLEKELQFREHYLVSGNIRAAARNVGLPSSTACDIAKRLREDPEFRADREDMYARALGDAERMMLNGIEIALDRLEAGPIPAALLDENGRIRNAEKVSIQDAGPGYLRGIVEGYKAIVAARKAAADTAKPAIPPAIRILLHGEDDAGS